MNFNKIMQKKIFNSWATAAFILLLPFSYSFGQDAIEKKKPKININYFNINSDSFFVKVSSNYKDEKFIPIENQDIKLYFNEAEKDNFLGDVVTDPKGEGIIYLPKKFKGMIETLSSFDLVAETDADSKYKKGSGSATLENPSLELQTKEADSAKIIRVFVFAKGEKAKKPLKGIEVNFFVKRMIGLLPLSEESVVTDSAGMAEIEYTIKGLPGSDSLGTLIVGAKLSDADTYGNIMSMKETQWGKKTFFQNVSVRALWAPADRVPVWLLFLACAIIFSVWGTIIYILFQVFKILKLGKQEI